MPSLFIPVPTIGNVNSSTTLNYDELSQAFHDFHHSSTSTYYCECKLKNEDQKRGRPGNEATTPHFYFWFTNIAKMERKSVIGSRFDLQPACKVRIKKRQVRIKKCQVRKM